MEPPYCGLLCRKTAVDQIWLNTYVAVTITSADILGSLKFSPCCEYRGEWPFAFTSPLGVDF